MPKGWIGVHGHFVFSKMGGARVACFGLAWLLVISARSVGFELM